MKKGLELPVNMIIVIAIAVLVLVVIAAYFATQTGSGFDAIAANGALTSSCGAWLGSNCQALPSSINTNLKNPDGSPVTLAAVLTKLSLDTPTAKARCGCPTATTP